MQLPLTRHDCKVCKQYSAYSQLAVLNHIATHLSEDEYWKGFYEGTKCLLCQSGVSGVGDDYRKAHLKRCSSHRILAHLAILTDYASEVAVIELVQ